jgi:hypothetical protein
MVTSPAAGQEKHAASPDTAQKLNLLMESSAAQVSCENSPEMPYEPNVLSRNHIRGDFARLVKNRI